MLYHVFPQNTLHYEEYGLLGNAVFACNRAVTPIALRVKGPDLSYLGFGKFGVPMPFTSCKVFRVYAGRMHIPRTPPAFLCGVRSILLLCTKPKVLGVTARRIIAGMADKHSLWNRAVCQAVGSTVRSMTQRGNAVPVLISPCHPKPTSIRATRRVHLTPEPFFFGPSPCGVVARHVMNWLALNMAALGVVLSSKSSGQPTTALTQMLYTFHASASYKVLAIPRPVTAGAGLLRA